MYACFITFFFLVSFNKSGGTAFGTVSGADLVQRRNFTFHA
jgi:hypothetical protein